MALSNKKEDNEKKRKEKLRIKLKKQKQINFFGLKYFPVKQMQMKKVGPNQYENGGIYKSRSCTYGCICRIETHA